MDDVLNVPCRHNGSELQREVAWAKLARSGVVQAADDKA
jgi:hypothetical protein